MGRAQTVFLQADPRLRQQGRHRSDKLTRGTFAELLTSPSSRSGLFLSKRMIEIKGQPQPLKIDIRAYVYAGEVQLFASCLYMGQTTNFRTQGGGFAPVFTSSSQVA